MDLHSIPDCIEVVEGLPHVRWKEVDRWLDEKKIPCEQWDACYHQLVRTWLDELIGPLEGEYALYDSEHFVAMLPFQPSEAAGFLEFCEYTRGRIIAIVGETDADSYGPHVTMVFDGPNDMARYIAPYMPEQGESRLAPGIFLSERGYMHIALMNTDPGSLHASLTHELVHNLLAYRRLPSWIDEGATVILTDALTGSVTPSLDSRMSRRHELHWNETTIQRFWSGWSFGTPGWDSTLSYSLALAICQILKNCGDFPQFLKTAQAEDAGESAAREAFGFGLSDAVAEILGEGDWSPKPECWKDEGEDAQHTADDAT